MWRKLHVWGGVILALPMLIIGVSTIFIAHGEALGAKQVRFGEMVADHEPKRLVATAQGILLGGKQGVVQLDSNFQVQQHWLPGTDIKALRELGGQLYATAKLGLYQQNGNDWTQLYQGDVEDVALWQNSLVILDKKQGLMQQQGSNWVLLKAYGKTEGPYDLKKLMMDLHSGEAIFGDYDWIWMDILGAYILIFTISGIWLWSRRSQSA